MSTCIQNSITLKLEAIKLIACVLAIQFIILFTSHRYLIRRHVILLLHLRHFSRMKSNICILKSIKIYHSHEQTLWNVNSNLTNKMFVMYKLFSYFAMPAYLRWFSLICSCIKMLFSQTRKSQFSDEINGNLSVCFMYIVSQIRVFVEDKLTSSCKISLEKLNILTLYILEGFHCLLHIFFYTLMQTLSEYLLQVIIETDVPEENV